jgi:hypothetical protein
MKTVTHELDMRDGRQSMYVQDNPSKKKAKGKGSYFQKGNKVCFSYCNKSGH